MTLLKKPRYFRMQSPTEFVLLWSNIFSWRSNDSAFNPTHAISSIYHAHPWLWLLLTNLGPSCLVVHRVTACQRLKIHSQNIGFRFDQVKWSSSNSINNKLSLNFIMLGSNYLISLNEFNNKNTFFVFILYKLHNTCLLYNNIKF